MEPTPVDPTDPSVLRRNYDYAQKNCWILSMWYGCDVHAMMDLLVRAGIELSANDRRRFGATITARG